MRAIFCRLGTVLPSSNKWWTFEPTLCLQGLGALCHSVLGRTFAKAFQDHTPESDYAAAVDNPNEDDYHVFMSKKIAKSLTSTSMDSHIQLAHILWISEPVDLLDARIQHLDAHSMAAVDLANMNCGPLVDLQATLGNLAR